MKSYGPFVHILFHHFISRGLWHPPRRLLPKGGVRPRLTGRLPAAPAKGRAGAGPPVGTPAPPYSAFMSTKAPPLPRPHVPGRGSHQGLAVTRAGNPASAAGLVGPFDPKGRWVQTALGLWDPASPWAQDPVCTPVSQVLAVGATPGVPRTSRWAQALGRGRTPPPRLEGSREAGQLCPPALPPSGLFLGLLCNRHREEGLLGAVSSGSSQPARNAAFCPFRLPGTGDKGGCLVT